MRNSVYRRLNKLNNRTGITEKLYILQHYRHDDLILNDAFRKLDTQEKELGSTKNPLLKEDTNLFTAARM